MENLYEHCTLCPRKCGVNRLKGERGYCGMTSRIVAARASLHMWEEPSISGENGSGTVFFTGCNVKCVYCQNHKIANNLSGKEITVERLSEIFLQLQEKNAHNINLVTATHFVPDIVAALDIAKKHGLKIPVVYNTSGYESIENIQRLCGYVNIYLPDFKYSSDVLGKKYSNTADYPTVALSAIREMLHQVGKPQFDGDGMLKSGVVIRHLVLPGNIKASKSAVKLIYDAFGDDVFISIMKQYTPMPNIDKNKFPELCRKLTTGEYNAVINYASSLGVTNGYIQDGDNQSQSYIPEFDNSGV